MIVINQNDKLADIVRKDFMLFSVLNRLGIDMAYNELNIKEACAVNKIDINLFLFIVNSFINPHFTPNKELLNFNIKDLVVYLINSHKVYRDDYIPSMKTLFMKIREVDNNCGIILVNDIYLRTQISFINHIKLENDILFPFITKLVDNRISNCEMKSEQVINLMEAGDHSNFSEELYDLINIFIKYVRPTCKAEMTKLFGVLTSFEKDLSHHMHIEDKYLYPRVKKMLHG